MKYWKCKKLTGGNFKVRKSNYYNLVHNSLKAVETGEMWAIFQKKDGHLLSRESDKTRDRRGKRDKRRQRNRRNNRKI